MIALGGVCGVYTSDEEVFTTWTKDLDYYGVSVVYLCGELDASTVPVFLNCVREVIKAKRHIILDVNLLAYVDSTGVAAFLATRNTLASAGLRMCLLGCHGIVSRTLQITRFDRQLTLADDYEAALAVLID